jgi:inorganic pyrophosphatase
MRPRHLALLALSLLVPLGACATRDYLRDADPVNGDLSIHVVIENPAGSSQKWEVRSDGRLVQEQVDGEPIVIPHLPWPVNGGMIPRTLLSAELGGDGEPVDVLVLGPSIERGSLVRARPIGLFRMLDRLERDDKVLAVVPGTPLATVADIDDLEARFPGVTTILETWYATSGGGSKFQLQGFGGRGAANLLIAESALAFEGLELNEALPVWAE